MSENERIAVIGAGLAGLACARGLADAGHSLTVFDKARELGGRMATRRANGWRFDHGAVVLRPVEATFTDLLAIAQSNGCAAHWPPSGGWTGLPRMSAVVKPLADGLDVRLETEVTGLRRDPQGWRLHGSALSDDRTSDQLILAIAQPQAMRLLPPWPEVSARIAGGHDATLLDGDGRVRHTAWRKD